MGLKERQEDFIKNLDARYGKSGEYYKFLDSTPDIVSGLDILTYGNPVVLVGREGRLTVDILKKAETLSISNVEQAWYVRQSYITKVNPQDVIEFGSESYTILGYVSNDDFNLVNLIFTRKRRDKVNA